MDIRINNSIFNDYLKCTYKAYLKINGEVGEKSDYEIFQNNLLKEYKVSGINFLKTKWMPDEIIDDISVNQFINNDSKIGLNLSYTDDDFSVLFDGIEKIVGSGKKLVPVIFTIKENITIAEKLSLAFYGFVLGDRLNQKPSFGRVIHGATYKNVRVNFDKLLLKLKPFVNDIQSYYTSKNR